MVTWGATGPGPSAIGAPGPYEIRSTDWEFETGARPIAKSRGETGPADPTAVLRGTASDLTIPATKAHIVALDRDTSYHLTAKVTLPEASYLLRLGSPARSRGGGTASPWAELRFDGPAMLEPDEDDVHLRLPERDSLTLSFPTQSERPAPITVGETPADIATVLSHAGSGITATGPERALPGERPRPPEIETGRRTEIPAELRRRSDDTGIELHLPKSLESLFVGAPLAYYLGASVTVGEVRQPRLNTPATGFEYVFDGDSFANEIRSALRRVVYLDFLVTMDTAVGGKPGSSPAGGHSTVTRADRVERVQRTERFERREGNERTVVEREIEITERVTRERTGQTRPLSASRDASSDHETRSSTTRREFPSTSLPAGLDPGVATASLAERLPQYFEITDDTIDRALPEYHETTTTRTDADHLECLPHLLDSLSAVEPRNPATETRVR